MTGPVTLKHSFEKEGDPEHLGGTEYLAELASSIITMMNAEDGGHTIDNLYMRCELIGLGQDLRRHACKPRLEREHVAMAINRADRRPSVPAGRGGKHGMRGSDIVRDAT